MDGYLLLSSLTLSLFVDLPLERLGEDGGRAGVGWLAPFSGLPCPTLIVSLLPYPVRQAGSRSRLLLMRGVFLFVVVLLFVVGLDEGGEGLVGAVEMVWFYFFWLAFSFSVVAV